MHLFLVCAKLYKSEVTQAQVEAEVNNTESMFESGELNPVEKD